MRCHCILLAIASAFAPALFAQSNFEAAVSGGVSQFTSNVLGADVFSTGATSNSTIKLNDGFRLTFRIGVNLREHLGGEVGFAYNHSRLHFDGPPVSEQGVSAYQGFVDALAYATPEKARIRPFAAAGINFTNFIPPGGSTYNGDTKFGFNYGGGLKVRVRENWEVRFDVRQYETAKPFQLGGSGRLYQNEYSVGIGYVL